MKTQEQLNKEAAERSSNNSNPSDTKDENLIIDEEEKKLSTTENTTTEEEQRKARESKQETSKENNNPTPGPENKKSKGRWGLLAFVAILAFLVIGLATGGIGLFILIPVAVALFAGGMKARELFRGEGNPAQSNQSQSNVSSTNSSNQHNEKQSNSQKPSKQSPASSDPAQRVLETYPDNSNLSPNNSSERLVTSQNQSSLDDTPKNPGNSNTPNKPSP